VSALALGRRAFLKLSGIAALGSCLRPLARTTAPVASPTDPTHVLRIRRTQVELSPGRCITTLTFNGQLPAPLLRGTVGQPMRIDICNESDSPERIHWHGQDPGMGEPSVIAPGSLRRVELTPQRPGLYLYHSDVIAAARLDSGLYSGLAGGLLVEPRDTREPLCDGHGRERVVVLKEYEPFIHRAARGCEIAYKSLTISGLAPGDLRTPWIHTGESILLHVLNASATQAYALELPGHHFEVVALDGNPLPRAVTVARIYLGPAERVTARLASDPAWRPQTRCNSNPGWNVCSSAVEVWDYTRFGAGRAPKPDTRLDVVLSRHEAARSGLNRWSINGSSFAVNRPHTAFRLKYGVRYRLTINNTSDEIIPVHLQRHRLQITSIDGRPTAGVLKDVVSIGPGQRVEVDLVADSPGRALFYCTRQLHRDFGLMALVDYT
jgi:FtsP/CotA-like multicopper oxidase with cupredoxin domain